MSELPKSFLARTAFRLEQGESLFWVPHIPKSHTQIYSRTQGSVVTADLSFITDCLASNYTYLPLQLLGLAPLRPRNMPLHISFLCLYEIKEDHLHIPGKFEDCAIVNYRDGLCLRAWKDLRGKKA